MNVKFVDLVDKGELTAFEVMNTATDLAVTGKRVAIYLLRDDHERYQNVSADKLFTIKRKGDPVHVKAHWDRHKIRGFGSGYVEVNYLDDVHSPRGRRYDCVFFDSRASEELLLNISHAVAGLSNSTFTFTEPGEVVDYRAVPFDPPEKMCGKESLARAIMLSFDFCSGASPHTITTHLRHTGIPVPEWLKQELGDLNSRHVLPKATRCVIIYKAMLEDYSK